MHLLDEVRSEERYGNKSAFRAPSEHQMELDHSTRFSCLGENIAARSFDAWPYPAYAREWIKVELEMDGCVWSGNKEVSWRKVTRLDCRSKCPFPERDIWVRRNLNSASIDNLEMKFVSTLDGELPQRELTSL